MAIFAICSFNKKPLPKKWPREPICQDYLARPTKLYFKGLHMKKLFNTLNTAKNIRSNICRLDDLLDLATSLGQVAAVSRRAHEYNRQIRSLLRDKPHFLARIELYDLLRQLRHLRNRMTRMTIIALNGEAA